MRFTKTKLPKQALLSLQNNAWASEFLVILGLSKEEGIIATFGEL